MSLVAAMMQDWRDDFNLLPLPATTEPHMVPNSNDVDRYFKQILLRMSPFSAAWLLNPANIQVRRYWNQQALRQGPFFVHYWVLDTVGTQQNFAVVAVAPLALEQRLKRSISRVIALNDGTNEELYADDFDGWACAFERTIVRHQALLLLHGANAH
jgi:hypothetical protein